MRKAKPNKLNQVTPMNRSVYSGPQAPEEFQRQLADFVRQLRSARSQAAPQPESPESPEGAERRAKADEFEFAFKPREVREYLHRFVIKPDEATKVLRGALCDPYHHVRLA